MRAAILGAGSLGLCMAAFIKSNGGEVELIGGKPENVAEINKNGITVTGLRDLRNIPVKAVTLDEAEGAYDLVIVLIKQTANAQALPKLLKNLNKDSIICTLQNGLPEPNVAAIAGKERTIGGILGWGAARQAPSVSRYTTGPQSDFVELGGMPGEMGEKVRKAAEFLKLQGEVRLKPDLPGIRWSKLLMNSSASGMSAACGSNFLELFKNDDAAACCACAGREVLLVARALGIKLPPLIKGFDFEDLDFQGASGLKRGVEWMRGYYAGQGAVKASMLQDMEKDIPCEIEFINGAVRDNGAKAGVLTPFNNVIIQTVRDFESKKSPFPSIKNTENFRDLLADWRSR